MLPNGEPSSFFGFGDMAEGPDDEWEEDEVDGGNGEGGDGDGDGDGADGGRVRSDFHSGGGPAARFRPY